MSEQARLIAEVAHRADAERRTLRFSLLLTLTNVAFALAPAVPRSKPFFGLLTLAQSAASVAPALLVGYAANLVYHRVGSDDRRFQRLDVLETFLSYASAMGFIFFSEVRWSPLYSLPVFSAMYFGLSKPFHHRRYLSIIALAFGALMLALVLVARTGDALVSLGVMVASSAAFVTVARSRRSAVLLEADRNVARARMKALQLDDERERIARSVAESVAQRLLTMRAALTAEPRTAVKEKAAAQAAAVISDLRAITASSREELPSTLGELSQIIEASVTPLCVNAQLRVSLEGPTTTAVEPTTALAATRIVQELVRNAITHGAARTVGIKLGLDGRRMSIQVNDDGAGLRPDQLERSTGGLRNVERWAGENAGVFQCLASAGGGTSLLVTLRTSSDGRRS